MFCNILLHHDFVINFTPINHKIPFIEKTDLSPPRVFVVQWVRLQWRDLEIWQCGEKQTIERSAPVQVQARWWEGGELLWWDWRGDWRGDNVMTKWESRGVRTNVYWWRSVLYTSSRRGSDYTDLVTLASPHSYQHFTPDLSEQLVPDINIRSSYISLSPREKKIQVAIWRVSGGKKPWETWEKMPSVACKFMLIEAQDMWEHFLLTFNKDKQTGPLPLRGNNNNVYY